MAVLLQKGMESLPSKQILPKQWRKI